MSVGTPELQIGAGQWTLALSKRYPASHTSAMLHYGKLVRGIEEPLQLMFHAHRSSARLGSSQGQTLAGQAAVQEGSHIYETAERHSTTAQSLQSQVDQIE